MLAVSGVALAEQNMNYDLAQSVFRGLEIGFRLENALSIGCLFVWLTGFYILYQMYRLRFLKVLIVSELLWIAQWLWYHRSFFVGFPEKSPDTGETLSHMVIMSILDFCIRIIPLVVSTIGAIMAVRYLQQKWKLKVGNQQPAAQVQSEGAPSD